jgi:G3E family GTPase
MTEMRRIAATVIGGFLGAGKTTLINQWLRAPSSARVMVLVNDFGALNIDAELIVSRNGDTLALTNGCICCQMGGDLTQALIRVLDSTQPLDELWIEASGVSDPGRIARLIGAVPEFDLGGVIVVVDALAIASHIQNPMLHDTLLAQILAADCVLLTKTDSADAAQLTSVKAFLHECHPHALCLDADQSGSLTAQIKDMQIFSPVAKAWMPNPGHERRFSAWMGRPTLTLSVAEWQKRLGALPQQVLRLKGFVRSLEHGWSCVQLAGSRCNILPCDMPPIAGESLVAIALRGSLPREALDGLLA